MNTAMFNKVTALLQQANRPITLCAVVKTFGPTEIEQAATLGIKQFGESYLQEAITKYNSAWWPAFKSQHHLFLRFIGHLQSNKAAKAAALFDSVDSVDSIKLASNLDKAREGMSPLTILLQYNPLKEASKHGLTSLEDLRSLALFCQNKPNLILQGIMIIAPIGQSAEAFTLGKAAFDYLNSQLSTPLTTLSMGMSDDYETALNHGSTMVRLGQALFGGRL